MQVSNHPNARISPALAAASSLIVLSSMGGAQTLDAGLDVEALAQHGSLFGGVGLARRGDTLVGTGPDYRAEFEPGSFRFTPALGADATERMPISFTLESVRRGGELVLLADDRVAPTTDGPLVVYERAAGIDERYEVVPEGVHQTFLFDSLPAGEGDLVVRGRLDTELGLKSVATDDGARFELEGVGGVHWGGVTGIDADGVSVTGDLRVDGDVLELVLPGEFVADAAFPLLLDPLVGADVDVSSNGNHDVNADVSYSGATNVYCVVWSRVFSLGDVEIRGRMFGPTGAPVTGTFTVTNLDHGVALAPAIGYVALNDKFVVAYQTHTGAPGAVYQIEVLSIDPTDASVVGPVAVAPSGNHQRNPDVCGDRQSFDNEATVVWDEDGVGVQLQLVSVFAGGSLTVSPANVETIDFNAANSTKTRPAIASSFGDSGLALVAWEAAFDSGLEQIECRVIDRNGNLMSPEQVVDGGLSGAASRPSVDGNGDRWLVAFEQCETGACTSTDVHGRGYQWENGSLNDETGLILIEAQVADVEADPAVAWTGDYAIVAYTDVNGSTADSYAVTIDPVTGQRCEDEMVLEIGSAADSFHVGIGADWAGGDGFNIDDALIVVSSIEAGDSDLVGYRYDQPSPPVDLGGSCGEGGRNLNPAAIENNLDFSVHLDGAAANRPTFFLFAQNQGADTCGPCSIAPVITANLQILSALTDADGDASIAIPIPNGVAGATVYTQWATYLPGGPCPLLDGFVLSNGLVTPILDN